MLSVAGLKKIYPGRGWKAAPVVALDDVSFTLGPGESLGILGESGSGKSTLGRLVSRLIEPTAGRILFDGEDIGAISPQSFVHATRRREIQHIFQDAAENLTPHMTAYAAIADPLRRLMGLSDVETRVHELADSVALSRDLLHRYPHQLSGGQKARVGIARGLASQPRLLVLDEPTAALDVSVQAAILKLLHRLRGEFGMSYLVITHDVGVVRLMCERVLIMRHGRVVETGETAHVLANPQSDYGRTLLASVPKLPAGKLSRP
ncbi:MAG: ABC transporter ATP-binding protein [Hyphomicrobiales bacterium]|nr:MAG: ABC transporter ATP-binding protein [Hyphomicrobiales bacterium]